MKLLKKICSNVFKIKENEFSLVQLFFFYIATITAAYTILSTTAITLFLSHLTKTQLKALLPWLAISIAPSITIVAFLYRRFLDKFKRILLITYTSLFFLISLIVIRSIIYIFGNQSWLLFFLMIWDETFSVIMIMVFFTYLGDYFHTLTARRLYGYITTGMALGAPIGGFISVFLLRYMNAANLIFVTILMLIISNIIALIIASYPSRISAFITEVKAPISLKDVFNNKYLNLIFITVIMAGICSNIEVYQFLYMTEETLAQNDIGVFIAKIFAWIGIVQIIINLFVIRKSLEWFGVIANLLILPMVFVILSLGFIINPIFAFAATIKFVDATFSNSFYHVIQQMLYLPLPERIRVHGLSIAVGVVNTAARLFSGVILLLLTYLIIPIRYYSILIFIPALIWLILLFIIKKPYQKILAASSE